jgi:hypothetical protein
MPQLQHAVRDQSRSTGQLREAPHMTDEEIKAILLEIVGDLQDLRANQAVLAAYALQPRLTRETLTKIINCAKVSKSMPVLFKKYLSLKLA